METRPLCQVLSGCRDTELMRRTEKQHNFPVYFRRVTTVRGRLEVYLKSTKNLLKKKSHLSFSFMSREVLMIKGL